MRHVLIALFAVLSFSFAVQAKKGPAPRKNIRVNLLDKKYKVSGVTTVGELQLQLQQKSGVEPFKQGHVMFGTRELSPTDVLSEVGVKNGEHLEIVSSKKNPKSINNDPHSNSPIDNVKAWDRLVEFAVDCFHETRRLGKTRWKNDVPQTLMDLMIMTQKVVRSSVFEQYMATDATELYQIMEGMRQVGRARNLSPEMPFPMQEALKDPILWRRHTLQSIEEIKNLDLEGAQGEQILRDFRYLEATGMMTELAPMLYQVVTKLNQDDDEN